MMIVRFLAIATLLLGGCSSPDASSAAQAAPTTPDPVLTESAIVVGEMDLPEFEVVQHKDVSYDFGPGDSATRLSIRVEIPEWPVTKEQLQALVDQLVEAERDGGWQAISITMGADRRESSAAYAVFDWAPGGDWGRAHEGDPDTWAGYEFSIEWGSKMEKPQEADCEKPPPLAFQYNKELWEARMSKSERQIIRDIAARHDDTPEHVTELLEAVLEWEFC